MRIQKVLDILGLRTRRSVSLELERLEQRLLLSSAGLAGEDLELKGSVIEWSGDIPDGTVWSGGDVHRVVGDVRVPQGATLTIQPGAIVQFN